MQKKFLIKIILGITSLLIIPMVFFTDIPLRKLNAHPSENIAGIVPYFYIQNPGDQKAVYLSGYSMGSIEKREEIYKLVEETELNSIVFDVKWDRGYVFYNTDIELFQDTGAVTKYYDIDIVIGEMKERNIYSIARIVLFKDDVIPRARPDLAIQDMRNN